MPLYVHRIEHGKSRRAGEKQFIETVANERGAMLRREMKKLQR